MEAKGHTGVIEFDGQFVTIKRKGLTGAMMQGGKGEKRIPLGSISAVQWREPGMLTNGFIAFTIPGGMDAGGGTYNAVRDENAVVVTKKQAGPMLALRDAVNAAIAGRQSGGGSAPAPDLADQLQKLAALRDQGILSPEEFEAKKADILSRM